MKTGYDQTKELESEAETSIAFARTTYAALPLREAYQKTILRLLVVIVRLLLHINSKT